LDSTYNNKIFPFEAKISRFHNFQLLITQTSSILAKNQMVPFESI
jgi:hypothetical protein